MRTLLEKEAAIHQGQASDHYTLLEKCWQISPHVTDDAIAKLYVT